MANLLPLQPRFNVFVSRPGKKMEYEITNYVKVVSMEIDQSHITTLTMEVSKPELHLEYLQRYYKLDLYGGYLDTESYFTGSPGDYKFVNPQSQVNNFFRYMFNGQVRQIQMHYNEDGTKSLTVTAVDASWGATPAKYKEYYAYPSKDSARTWADKAVLKASDIVKGFVEEEMKIPLEIDMAVDHEYTTKRPFVQDGISDWAALRKLAKANNCYIWTAVNDTAHTVKFIDKGKAMNTTDQRIEFVWLNRDGDSRYPGFKEGDYLREGNSTDELSKLKDNQIQFLSVEVEESPSLDINGTQAVQISVFNEETGNNEQKLVSYDETKDEIIYYELDRAMVDNMVRTNPQEADRLTNMGPFGIPEEDFDKYYKKVRIPKGIINAIDRPLMGINVTAKIKGNVLIEPFQSYSINGISRYSTLKRGKKGRYFLNGITHTWNEEGFMTELRFIS